jgi:hypothetical protein
MAKRAKKRKSTARRTSRPQKKLSDLFHETLKDIYFTENKIIKTLPKMAKAAQSKELAAAFNKHIRETQGQVKRLDRVFRIIGKPARGKPCEAINGIADEGAEIMKEFRGMPALDAGLVAAAQAVEHRRRQLDLTRLPWRLRRGGCPVRYDAHGLQISSPSAFNRRHERYALRGNRPPRS